MGRIRPSASTANTTRRAANTFTINSTKADPMIAQVTVQGFSDQDLYVEIPEGALRRYGVSVDDIQAAIARQSIACVTYRGEKG